MPGAIPSIVSSFGPSAPPSFVTTYLDNNDGGAGFPTGLFVGFAFLVICIGVGSMVWRVSTARRIAEENGLDPRAATRVALLDDNAVTATYLAGNLQRQQQRQPAPAPAAPVRSVKARLAELQELHDSGDISDDEYAEGRKHIINGA